MDVRPRLALVMSSRQLLIAQVAVALCSGVVDQSLGDWEEYRTRVSAEFDVLAVRLAAARDLGAGSGARLAEQLDSNGHPVVAVELELTGAETANLKIAVERLRGILARTGEFEGALDEDLDDVVFALT